MSLAALDTLAALDGAVVLAGVRHHSPACARAVDRLLRTVRPRRVLIEGPVEFTDMAALQDPALRPPVALFSYVVYPEVEGTARQRAAGWYPLCDYSPELVAVQTAGALGIPVAFCDLGMHGRLQVQEDLQARLTEAGRDLFEAPVPPSALRARLLERTGARDEDDLWDRLFELSERPLATFLRDVAAYGTALRETTSPAQIEAQGDAAREAFMADAVRQALATPGSGPVVLVCGAFHLAGVQAALQDGLAPPEVAPLPAGTHHGVHLVPYDFRRLRRLQYAAGMPQPAWYQAAWEARGPAPPWLEMLVQAARYARDRGEPGVSTAEVQGAAELAQRLAAFRGHPRPSRVDVLDAARTCWVKGTSEGGQQRLLALVEEAFCGDRAGVVGPRAGDPPLVRAVDAELAELSLDTPSGESRELRLRPVRAERDRQRSQALARLQYLDVAYGRLQRGPDLVTGAGLERVEQVWELGWDAESRAMLFERSAYGATLEDAAAERLRAHLEKDPPHAEHAVQRLGEAGALGLQALLPHLQKLLVERIESDQQLTSMLRALHRLVLLFRYRDAMGTVGLDALEDLLVRCWGRALWLLTHLPTLPEAQEADAIQGIVALEHATATLGAGLLDPDALASVLLDVHPRLGDVPGIAGAVAGVLWRTDRLPLAALAQGLLASFLAPVPDSAGRYVSGLLAVARRAYLDQEALLRAAGAGLAALDEADFRSALPRLRRAHTALTPGETSRLADRVARRWGDPRRTLVRTTLDLDADALQALQEASAAVQGALADWGLALPPAPPPPASDALSEEDGETTAERAPDPELVRRWRLVLGRYASALPPLSGTQDGELDSALGFLYDREYAEDGRGQRQDVERTGGLGAAQLTVPEWINTLERLFPRETYERLEAEALERYGLQELVQDEEILARCEPSLPLLEAVLRLKHTMSPAVLQAARRVVAEVAAQLRAQLRSELEVVLSGRLRRGAPSLRGTARTFDARTTIRRSLRHFVPEQGTLVIARPWFTQQIRRLTDWRIIVCVDQSGSMLRSTIHAGVVASIFAQIRELHTHLIVFDTAVVDLTDRCEDPVETLLSVQLGGGTDIGQALGYCLERVEQPRKTLVVLITDLFEGADPTILLARAQRLVEGGSRLLVLAALDESGTPDYDRAMGQRLVALGAEVGAMTPRALVRWVGEVLG